MRCDYIPFTEDTAVVTTDYVYVNVRTGGAVVRNLWRIVSGDTLAVLKMLQKTIRKELNRITIGYNYKRKVSNYTCLGRALSFWLSPRHILSAEQ